MVLSKRRKETKLSNFRGIIIEQALREVRAMANLDHPGIVRFNSTWIEKPPDAWQVNYLK